MSVAALSESPPDSARGVFLAAGMRLYPSHGYQRLSVRLLAAEAGLSPGMFHHLFASKEAFVAEVLQRKYDAAFAVLQLQVRPGRGVRENLRDAMRFSLFLRARIWTGLCGCLPMRRPHRRCASLSAIMPGCAISR